MRSQLLVNFSLLLLVAALAFFALTGKDNNIEAPDVLTNVSAASINTLSIHHNNRVTTVEKTANRWVMTAPINIAANDFRVNTLLKLLDTVSYAKYMAATLDLKQYGLEQPKTSITFNNLKIDFGIINPLNNYRYVKANNEVHLIDDHYYPLLSSQTGALISRSLLPEDSKINKLKLPEQTLALNTQDKWTSTKDISTDAIVEVLDHWRNTEAFGVHEYYKREPLGTVEVHIDNIYDPIRFVITDVDPWLILARPDINIEYHFDLEHYDALLRPGAEKKLPEEFQAEPSPSQDAPLQPL
jgi:hypothetical protein